MTPLLVACYIESTDLVRELLKADACVTAVNNVSIQVDACVTAVNNVSIPSI
jgi:hypothetical protein